ncbi:MAG: hypothetical protein IPJ66_06150 [Bacteroidetes bacterium]|nr:hypothetical protein [Bacteroidota bacterium]
MQGHSVAEVGGDTFIENFSKCHGGMSHHTIKPTTFRQATQAKACSTQFVIALPIYSFSSDN